MNTSATSEIQSFNHGLTQPPTTLLANVSLSSLSLDDTLKEKNNLLEKNMDVVRVVLDCKKEIKKNPELLLLVKDYLDKDLHTLDFCNALEKSLEIAQNTQFYLHHALQRRFDEADPSQKEGEGGGTKYEKTILDELKRFKEFPQVFQSVHQHQLSMLQKLRAKKKKLERKMKSVKLWRKLSCIIFYAAYAGLLIFSVAAAIFVLPPIAEAISTACSAMEKWFDSMWKNQREVIKREKMIVSALKAGTSAGINEMDGIMVMVNLLEDQISSFSEDVVANFRDEEAVRSGIEKIGKKMELFMKSLDDFVVQANQCRRDMERARTVVYQKNISIKWHTKSP